MLIVNVTPEELSGAGKIATAANLHDIRLRSVSVIESNIDLFFDENDKSAIEMSIDYIAQKKEHIKSKSLSSVVGVKVKLTKKDATISYNVEYQVNYALPNIPVPEGISEDMFDSFAKNNGLLNCWPYIRSQIGNLSNDVGVPVILPLLKIQSKKTNVPKAKETELEAKVEIK